MKITLKNLTRLSAVGLLAATVGIVGCKSTGDRTTGQRISDNQVAKSVKKQLDDDPNFKFSDVHAMVYNGSVQLSGFVETPEQRTRAAELASHAPGARQVINQILLKGTPSGPATIRDPLGRESGRLMQDTNAAVSHWGNPPQQQQPQQPQQSQQQ